MTIPDSFQGLAYDASPIPKQAYEKAKGKEYIFFLSSVRMIEKKKNPLIIHYLISFAID